MRTQTPSASTKSPMAQPTTILFKRGINSTNRFIRFPLIQGEPFGPALMTVNQFGMIQAHQPENRRVDVVDMQAVLHRAKTQFVSLANDLSAFHATARHPHGKAGRIMVAAIALFAHRCAAKFPAPDYEG